MGLKTQKCSACKQVKPLVEFPRNKSRTNGYAVTCRDCYAENRRRFVALDATVSRKRKRTWADIIPEKTRHADSTYERVFQWLDAWQRTKILKPAQAEALYLHAVEMQTYQEISSFVGCDYTTVLYHYNQAIKRLREYYVDRLQREYGEDWIYVLCSPCQETHTEWNEKPIVEEI